MTKAILQSVLNANPTLTISGFGIYENCKGMAGYDASLSQSQLDTIFKQRRDDFFTPNNLLAFDGCRRFINTVQITPNLRGKNSSVSYALKHSVEHWAQLNDEPLYVPEGVFIAAALSMESEKKLIIKPFKGGLGAAINIKRS